MKLFICKNSIWVSKNAKINADFESVESCKQIHAKNVTKEKVVDKLSF
jgi:hypothetical protein